MTNSVFRACASSSKILKEKIFQCSENFQGKLSFSGQESCSKIWMIKNQWRAVRGGKEGSSSPTIIMKRTKKLGIQNNKLNTNMSLHAEKVQLLYDSNNFHSLYIWICLFFNSGESHEGRQRLLVLLSPRGFRLNRIEQFVTICGGERLPCNYLYVSSVTFISVTV